MWNDSNTQNDEQNIMFKSQCSHMWLQKSILSHVTTLTFVVTCDYIDFFLANVTVNHNVHTFTIIVHGYLFHSCLINVVNYNVLSFTVCGKECTHSYTNKLVQAAIEASLAHRLWFVCFLLITYLYVLYFLYVQLPCLGSWI